MDGRGYSLKDYGIKYVGLGFSTSPAYSILFQTVSGVIRNLNVLNADFTQSLTGTRYISLFTALITNGLIDNCKAEGNLKAVQGTGTVEFGIFVSGMLSGSRINNCINNIDIDSRIYTKDTSLASVIAQYLSGSFNCVITNCINNGNIITTTRAGGIVSFVSNSTLLLENNLNTGTIKSTATTSAVDASAGGILARHETGTVTLNNNINLGNVENINPNANAGAGGIIGSMYAASGSRTAILYNNINRGNITANSTTEGNAGGIIGSVSNSTASLFNNINTGTVESKGIYAGGAIGKAETSSTVTLDGNLNYGKKVF